MGEQMTEAMSKMAEIVEKAPEQKKREMESFLTGVVAGFEVAAAKDAKEAG